MLAPLRQILELLAGFYNRAVTLQSEKFMNGISGASRKMRNTRTKCEMLYSQRLAHSGQARATHRHTVQKGCVFKVTYAVVFQPLKACHMHWVDQKLRWHLIKCPPINRLVASEIDQVQNSFSDPV